ncbi:hypothetical protein J4464_01640 [Candidatus Woesearchaeota archaeon]|nr:hypothetical protein [uncultured archaeon]MBS3142068.1 hypothetical protein [Candidatus Woesearchaeota archaeon]
MKMRNIGFLAIVLFSMVAYSAFASAAVTIEEVKLDNDVLDTSGTNFVRAVERGESFEVKVTLSSDIDMSNVEIEAEIAGDARDDVIGDDTDVFDMVANRTYVKKLTLPLTGRMEEDEYLLRVRIQDRRNPTVEQTYALGVELPEHEVRIDDILFSPSGKVKAGRALLTTVRVENDGDRLEDGVKITVSIPELDLSASDYIDELEPEGEDDDETTSEELYLRIPECAEPGLYTVRVDVEFDDRDMRATEDALIEIIEGDACELDATEPSPGPGAQGPQSVITVGSQSQDITAGTGGAIYPITITNNGRSTKTYTISVAAADSFANVRISPSNVVVVNGGETKSIFVYVSALETTAPGQYGFSVSVSSGAEVQQIPLTANVVQGSAVAAGSLKRALEIGLVVLVVILVILGLIIGFNKLKSDEDERKDGSGAQTYY